MDIIQYLLSLIQYQYQQICWLLNFICRYIPLKQWAFDDSHSPKYQKFKVDELPVIKTFIKQDWQFLLEYYQWKYHKPLKPVQRRNGKCIPEDTVCPLCGAPHHFIYDNNGGNGQYQCKVCGQTFSTGDSTTTPVSYTHLHAAYNRNCGGKSQVCGSSPHPALRESGRQTESLSRRNLPPLSRWPQA